MVRIACIFGTRDPRRAGEDYQTGGKKVKGSSLPPNASRRRMQRPLGHDWPRGRGCLRAISRVLSSRWRHRDLHLPGRSFLSAYGCPYALAVDPRRSYELGVLSRRLFDLAPAGVCRATRVTASAVGSYPTVSPLPARVQAVFFLWHFPSSVLTPRSYLAALPMEPGLSSIGSRPIATVRLKGTGR